MTSSPAGRSTPRHNRALTPRSSVSSAGDPTVECDPYGLAWEENTPNCSVCNVKFTLTVRPHHCRICGLCICGACSPNLIQLDGQRGKHRACTPCVASAQVVPTVIRKLADFACSLSTISGQQAPSEPTSLEEVTAQCEESLSPLEDAFSAVKARCHYAELDAAAERQARSVLEAEVAAAKEVLLRLGEKMHVLGGNRDVPIPQAFSIEDVAEFCNSAYAPLQQLVERRKLVRSRSSQADPKQLHFASQAEGTPKSGDRNVPDVLRNGGPRWEDNTANCGACGVKVGKKHFRPRHHCRACGKCVCATCSPSSVQINGKLERVCTPCAAFVQQAPLVCHRVTQVGSRLWAHSGAAVPNLPFKSGVSDALHFCESAMTQLEGQSPKLLESCEPR